MKKRKNAKALVGLKILLIMAFTVLALSSISCHTAFAVSEADVQAKVEVAGKEAVSGNVLVWFLCAIAFLKVSQKIDSFMAGLGVNVGHTGGSMIAELMVAARGLGAARNYAGGHFGSGAAGQETGREARAEAEPMEMQGDSWPGVLRALPAGRLRKVQLTPLNHLPVLVCRAPCKAKGKVYL